MAKPHLMTWFKLSEMRTRLRLFSAIFVACHQPQIHNDPRMMCQLRHVRIDMQLAQASACQAPSDTLHTMKMPMHSKPFHCRFNVGV